MEKLSLENCICTLKKLQNAYSSQLDTGVSDELNKVIADLERIREGQKNAPELGQLSVRTLQIIAVVLQIVSNLKDWMK